MKIGNEYVEIKKGNKVYRKQNMILNTYLKKLFASQVDTEHESSEIAFCYIKLDTPLEVDYDSELTYNDFDIRLFPSGNLTTNIISTKNSIKISYNFITQLVVYKKEDGTWTTISGGNFNIFAGRKITGVAFSTGGTGAKCLTYLDTNNMDIIIDNNEEFRFTRVDNIISDGNCKELDYPLHLINDVAKKDSSTVFIGNLSYEEVTMAQLYSIGFGNTEGLMEEEYLINNVETDRDDYSITFDLSRTKKLGHYPSEDLQLGFYPTMDNSKYIIFKYKLYRRYYNSESQQYVITNLNKYYTMNKLNENFGNLKIKLKIERL